MISGMSRNCVKDARLYVHLSSSWYISFVPLQLVCPDFLRARDRLESGRAMFVTGGETNGS